MNDAPEIPIKRNQVWRRDFVEARRRVLALEAKDRIRDRGALETIQWLTTRIRRFSRDKSYEAQLDAVLSILELLAIDDVHRHLLPRQLAELNATAARILERHGVKPRSSRLAHLYGELEARTAEVASRRDEQWTAEWSRRVAEEEAGVDAELFDSVHLALRLGAFDEAGRRLLAVELEPLPRADLHRVRLMRVKVLRASGELESAAALLAELPRDADVRWEEAVLESMRSGDLEAQVKLTRLRGDERRPERLLDLFLWAHASAAKAWMKSVPRASSLKRTDKIDLDPAALSCAEAIERCHLGRGTLPSRLNALGRALDEADRIADPVRQMLVWAAAARWLVRVKRRPLAELPASRYRSISLGLTRGKNADVLRVLGDVAPSEGEVELVLAGELPPAKFRLRAPLVSRMVAELLLAVIRKKNPGREALALETAEILASHLEHLKGPLMKLGQMLGYYGFDLPEEVRDALCSLQDASTGIEFELVQKIIEEDLARPIDSLFAELDPVPIGTGSLGQVHRALTKDGVRVAVKVQYPDAPRMVASDLAALKALGPVLRFVLPRWDVRGIIDELDARVREECDYRLEAQHQLFFQRMLSHRKDVIVPGVIRSHSGSRVLTGELIRGERFEDFRRRASEEERTRAAEIVFAVWMETALSARSFNTDVQPGNLLFLEQGVAFLDFGSSVHWNDDEGRGFLELLLAVQDRDRDRFMRAFESLGFVRPPFDFDWAYRRLSGGVLGAVAEDRSVRIRFEDVKRELMHFFADDPPAKQLLMPPRYLLGLRAYWGLFSTLARLDAEVNLHRIVHRSISLRTKA